MSASALVEFDVEARRALLQAAAKGRENIDTIMRSVAAEVAMGVQRLDVILEAHGLDAAAWDRIKVMPRFHTMLTEAAVIWGATSNTKARIEAKMEAMLEDSLPTLYAALLKGDDLTPSKVKFVEAIMRGARVGEQANKASSNGVSINISLSEGRHPPTVTIDHDPGTDDM